MKWNKTFALALSALALLCTTATGCGGREKSICDKIITCEGGNDADRSACVDRWVGQTATIGAYKCGEAQARYLECVDTSVMCNSGKFSTNNCGSEWSAVVTCVNAASAYGVKW